MRNSNQSLYDHIWEEGWDEGADWLPIKLTQYRLSLKLIKLFPLKGEVLDVGGGNASFWEFAKDLRKNLTSLTLCDISPYATERAQKKGIKTVVMDITSSYPVFNEKFDAICCFEVMEHIQEDAKAIKNCFNMLKSGGYFYLSVPRSKHFWTKSDKTSCHVRRYETEEMILKLEKAGFDIKRVLTWGSFLFRLYQRLKGNLDPSFGKRKKNKIMQLLSYFIYHFFKVEDWLQSKKGILLYVVAQKPTITVENA